MPRGRGKFRGGRGGGGRNGRKDDGTRQPYQRFAEIVKENARLETYYNTLLDLKGEDGKKFWDALKTDLPNSFRFCGSKGHALAVQKLLQTRYIPQITKVLFNGETVTPPQPVPWFPDNLAWSMTTPKNVIRKFPPFAEFQRFLVSETSVGNISRQEIVSMIPPLLINLRPGMTVLDMCAAPGSKSAQLLEMIHLGEEARIRKVMRAMLDGVEVEDNDNAEDEAAKLQADPSDDGRATGMLIANDSDYKRCHMLVHQLKRLSSPNMIVTNHDATIFPVLRVPNPEQPSKPRYLEFDRILADVPCSGDGTLRKNIAIWKDWSSGNAIGLHATQVRILVRALKLLKVGGRVVYSTCSMNPIENEAVVAAAIERCGGERCVEIVDCSKELPLLKRVPGFTDWKVSDKNGSIWSSWKDVQQFATESNGGVYPSRLVDTMFPGEEGSERSKLPLQRCMRVYAHLQDTGAFFITVLEKKADVKVETEKENPKNTKIRAERESSKGSVKDEVKDGLKVEKVDENMDESKGESKSNVDGAEETPEISQPEARSNGVKRARSEEAEETGAVKKPKLEQDTNGDEVMAAETQPEVEPSADDSKVKEEEDPATPTSVNATEPLSDKTNIPNPSKPAVPKKKRDGPHEEPFKYLKRDHEVIQQIEKFYALSPRFPKDRFLVRNEMGEPAKAIYYTSELVREILTRNEGRGVKFVNAGVKMFVKQDTPSAEICRWRIQSEGMPILHGYVGPDRVVLLKSKETFHKLLSEMFPRFEDGHWENLGEIGKRVRDLGLGCCVLRVEPEGDDPDFSESMVIPLWRSFKSLNLMLPKEDRQALLLRIFNDTKPVLNLGLNGQQGNQPKAETEQTDDNEPAEEAIDVEGGGEQADVEIEDVQMENGDAANGEVHDAEGPAKITDTDSTVDFDPKEQTGATAKETPVQAEVKADETDG